MKATALSLIVLACSSAVSAGEPELNGQFQLDGGATVRVKQIPFEESKHEMLYCENRVCCPCKVDGQHPYGTAPCDAPETELKELVVTIEGKAYSLETDQMYNAWYKPQAMASTHKLITVGCKENICTVRGSFSDGAGSYVAEWKIQGGKSKRTLLTADEAIMFPFLEAMDKKE